MSNHDFKCSDCQPTNAVLEMNRMLTSQTLDSHKNNSCHFASLWSDEDEHGRSKSSEIRQISSRVEQEGKTGQ